MAAAPGPPAPRRQGAATASPRLSPAVRGVAAALAAFALAACGPQIGTLERGEEARVAAVFNGATLELDSELPVFLAEIDAPRGDAPYAAQSRAELEALALHRDVLLAYGGARRWQPPTQEGERRDAFAIAHLYVRSEGGRWFWLQHEMVARGAAFVRVRADNRARSGELFALEDQARRAARGLWGERAYQPITPRAAAAQALEANLSCTRRAAPYRVVEGRVLEAQVFDTRASLTMDAEAPFAVVVFGDAFTRWEGAALGSLAGARIRARGPLGVFRGAPQLCLDDGRQLEALAPES